MLQRLALNVKKRGQTQPHVNSKARILNLQQLARRVFKLEINCFFKIMASVGLLATFIGLSSNAPSKLQGGNLCGSRICHSGFCAVKTGIDFAHFGMELDLDFERTAGVYT